MTNIKFTKLLILVNGAVPLAMMAWDGYNHRLGTNPLEFVTHTTGIMTLIFLLVTLAVTPVRKLLGLPFLIKARRMAGLYAFFYGALHLLCYVWFDKWFSVNAIVEDTLKRPFIFLGMFGFLVMVPLAVTSTNAMVRKLGGRNWNRLHRLVYLAAIAGVVHYYLLVKADTRIPLAFGWTLLFLLGYRVLNRFFPEHTEKRPVKVEKRDAEAG